ncbi:transcriptional regulator [Shewanella sp. JM162201]|uniref:Transcriptional regulator n=1 Tax=Shewanella jiangmenensis TaxID=2837387 RepID=A0ABS5V1U1_9GAMM|nr:metalloregulator ArsR/SmtB family transcription factor [Shewanella jiangmenensis]MBT1443599.1 transcriptional regulator [Shewanella jiangmenensis]
MKTCQKILELLKQHGPMTAAGLADALGLTSMGVRQHLQAMEAEGNLAFDDISEGRGRPARYWKLTDDAHSQFGDRHSELTLRLIDSVKVIFGDAGMDALISHREAASEAAYLARMAGAQTVAERLRILALIRSEEGYMASIEQDGDHWWLYENHCPICAAASSCQNFCRSELMLFRRLLGEGVTVERSEHIIEGARRCSYRISWVESKDQA